MFAQGTCRKAVFSTTGAGSVWCKYRSCLRFAPDS